MLNLLLQGMASSSDDRQEESGGFFGNIKKFLDFIFKIIDKVFKIMPIASVTGIHIPSLSLEKLDLSADVLIKNRSPLSIPLVASDYLVESDGNKLISGEISDVGNIEPRSEKTVTVEVCFIFEEIRNIGLEIRPGSVIPFRIKVDLNVHVPIFGKLTLPLEETGNIPIPDRPDIDLEKIQITEFSFEETVSVFHLKLENKNEFEMGLKGLEYEIWLCEISIGGAQIEQSADVGHKGVTLIEIPITFRPKDFGKAIWEAITEHSINYAIKGHVDVDTPFGAMKLPIDKEGGAPIHKVP